MTALQRGDLGPETTALDLGCGTGMLATAAALVETHHVLGVDCDAAAIQVAMVNAEQADVEERVDFLQARVRDLSAADATAAASASNVESVARRPKGGGGRGRGRGRGRSRGGRSTPRSSTNEARQLILSDDDGLPLLSNCVDTVLTNPPFGTKANAGMDLRFLRTATRLSRRAVYSFHKTSTRDFLVRQVEGWGMEIQIVAEMRFDLPQTYKFHQKKSVDVQVDLIRVLVNKGDQVPLSLRTTEEVVGEVDAEEERSTQDGDESDVSEDNDA